MGNLMLADILTMWCVSCGVKMESSGMWQNDKCRYQCPRCGALFAIGMIGTIINPEYRLFDEKTRECVKK